MHHLDHKQVSNQKGLLFALILTAGIMLVEFFGGLMTNSLALLSDSGHMLSDVSALLFSLLAMRAASKPASDIKPFGYHRFEILAALFNGVSLVLIAALILWEAFKRLLHPQMVGTETMMLIAVFGLIANLLSAWALLRKSDVKNNINVRSAYLHVLGDALGSVGAIVAGALMHLYSWYIADPLISAVIAVVILKGTYGVIQQSIHILMEGKPNSIDYASVKNSLQKIDGVLDIHDLRIWTITSGIHSFCCHIAVSEQADPQKTLESAIDLVKSKFGIEYVTIQVERPHLL